MNSSLRKDLKNLCMLPGVSSREEAVRAYIRGVVEPLAAEVREDRVGSLFVRCEGKNKTGRTIMLSAHMDEVGMMVRRITDEGRLKFSFVGAIDRRLVIGKRVLVGEKALPGVIGIKAFHLVEKSEGENVPKVEDLVIDMGFKDKEEAEKHVRPGDWAVFDTEARDLGDGFFKARALDDRVGCAVLLDLIRAGLPCDCWLVFTAQEEVGMRGATVAANIVRPDFAINVEGTTAADLPETPEHKKVCIPGGGPAILSMDLGSIFDRELRDGLRAAADRLGLPWQDKRMVAGGTDAAAIQRSRTGVPVAGIASPTRYIHAPTSVVKWSDIEAMPLIIREYLEGLSHD